MITAIRQSDNKKVLGNVIVKNPSESYRCDYCEKNVIHHKSDSEIKIGHFKHKSGESDCPNQKTGESVYHYNAKYDIYKYITTNWGDKLKTIEVEKWLLNKTIRSDIYIETKKNKIAIEVQANILTVSEIRDRTEKYTANNIYVLWILPYNYRNFYEYKLDLENNYDWILKDKVRFKEMEIFLYWSNNQRLFFWDLGHKYFDSFVCAFFKEYKNNDVEFKRYGEEHFYTGKTAKTIKTPSWDIEVSFNKMIVKDYPKINAKNRPYIIPDRKIFTYENNYEKSKS